MTERRKYVSTTPENSETPLEGLRSWVTPNRLFFVRNHFPVPELDISSWRLQIDGCVERPLSLTFDELTAMPERTVFATVECAGNGRSFLQPRAAGVQWGAGAIGHAEWTGVPVRDLLEKAGLKSDVVEIVFEGHDRGSEPDHPEPMDFARSLPLKKALQPDTLLVYRMNGELLEPNHGYPLRLFVPGWYGVASVKWLKRVAAINHVFRGYFQTTKYTIQQRTPKGVETVVVGPMAVKSEIIRPQPGATLGVGTHRVFGVAWAGEEAVECVSVSIDGGKNWGPAQLLGPRAAYSWTLWEYLWEVAQPGSYNILSRATSAHGRVQPMEHDSLNGGYLIHHSRPLSVKIEAVRRVQEVPADLDSLMYDMQVFAEDNARRRLDVELEFVGGDGI
jgi:DMSO/TMAO reductase YedYZ molybdopterin-dependent catalytic subunit